MNFRKSWGQRVCSFLFSLVMFAVPVLLWPALHTDVGLLCVMLLITVGLGTLLLFHAGPNDITFDVEHKTYRRVVGWPFFPKTRTGSCTEFWGVYVGQYQGANISGYTVGLTRWGQGGNTTLRDFDSAAAAEQLASEVMGTLELPRIIAPRTLRPPS